MRHIAPARFDEGRLLLSGFSLFLMLVLSASAQTLSTPEVDQFNVKVGTQTFSPRYHFTTNTLLVETAEAMRAMGSDVIKFYLGPGMSGQNGITLPGSITDLTKLVRDEPSVRRVLDMPFRHYVVWTYAFSAPGDAWWKNGYTAATGKKEYDEIYAMARHCLTNYNLSGKSFYLGHWEGDWYLLNNYDTSGNPSTTAIQGMIAWLNNRQQAVDDAMRDVPHTNVAVYAYTEANRVRDAMLNGPTNNLRVANAVLPYVTNLDFVSWSSYDGMDLSSTELTKTLNYLETHLATNKAVRISGRRVIIGEYGWGGSLSSAAQEPKTRAYIQRLLSWGPRFILFWEMYNNEPNKAYWLIDSNNVKAPCYFLHQRFIAQAKLQAARFWETNGRLPDDAEFNSLLKPSLNFPLYDPARLTVSNRDLTAVSVEAATVEGSVLQGKYGDDCARVFVFWGTGDGGTNRESWDNSQFLGVNTQFNTAVFSAALTNLNARTNYFFRFCATNSSGATWAPASSSFSTDVLRPEDFGYRLRVAFRGYDRGSTLTQFPALVILGPDVPGFSYSQFASRTGGDLRFTDPTGTREIPFELDEWNLDGNSYVWVNLPSLSSTNDFIYAYWGNPLATNAPVTATNGLVWSPNGEIIWHLKEVGLPLRDSAAKHSSVAGDPPARADGRVGHAGSFNGVTDGVSPGTIDLGDRFTLSAWVKMDPSANSIQTIWANKQGGSETAGLAFFINSYNSVDGKLILETGNGTLGSVAVTETSAVGAGVWHHVAAAVDRVAGSADLYVDGMNRTLLASARNDFTNQAPLYFGRFAGASAFWFKGAIDEARIEKEARSSDWVWATWMNVASNSVFQASEGVKNQAFAIRPSLLGDGGWSLAWGAAGVGWRLYSTTNLARNDSWIAAPETPVLANNQWQVTLTVERQSPQFFRLQAP